MREGQAASGTGTVAPPPREDSTTARMISMVRSASAKVAQARQRLGDPRDLVEESPGLIGEVVGVAGAHARRLHRDTTREVRQLRADDDLPDPTCTGPRLRVVEEVLGGPVLVERGPAAHAQAVNCPPRSSRSTTSPPSECWPL
ncbi:hypothetical protein [Streptomyces cellulosae]|uniref:Uncharacterized protein n=1 Tax=Streptomyces cellulosae TaxID=1968 RepID=A0ABW7YIM2_STRCE